MRERSQVGLTKSSLFGYVANKTTILGLSSARGQRAAVREENVQSKK